jgi:hypothetical protein
VLADGLLARALRDRGVAREALGGVEQRHGLAVPDPVADVVQVVGGVGDAGVLDDLLDGVGAQARADVAQQHARHRASDLADIWRVEVLHTLLIGASNRICTPERGFAGQKASDPPGGAGRSREE